MVNFIVLRFECAVTAFEIKPTVLMSKCDNLMANVNENVKITR